MEADSLHIVQNLYGVHTPHLIDYTPAAADHGFLLTTWVDGPILGEVLDDLESSDIDKVVEDLAGQFQVLQAHTMSPPSHAIFDVSGGPMDDTRIPWVFRENPRVFTSQQDFRNEVWMGLDWQINSELKTFMEPWIHGADAQVVLCHGDLQPWNIIVPGGLDAWRAGKSSLCLIDWQYCAWAPDYWDALKATWMESPEEKWSVICRRIFKKHLPVMDADYHWRKTSRVLIL